MDRYLNEQNLNSVEGKFLQIQILAWESPLQPKILQTTENFACLALR